MGSAFQLLHVVSSYLHGCFLVISGRPKWYFDSCLPKTWNKERHQGTVGHFLMDKRQKICTFFVLKVDLPLLQAMFEKLRTLDAYFSKKWITWSSHYSLLILKGLRVDCPWLRLLVEPFPGFPINYHEQFRKNSSNSLSGRYKTLPIIYKSYQKAEKLHWIQNFFVPP